ncbi:MAG: DUF2167 domain-containing protein [Alphaproteobacteria bacterium]|nr:DUF2167 domain-containing protein [Alphaproteobacteria bacterium]
MSKINGALIGAFALVLSSTAFADIPPPKPESPPATDSLNEPQPSTDQTTTPAAPEAEQPATTDVARSKEEEIANSLVKRDGVIALPGGQATVTVGEGFAYLDPADSEKLLTQLWGNPPDAVGQVLGIIIPRDISPLDPKSWAAVLTYDNDGHVSDDDAASINYDDLLKDMQKGVEEENQQRQSQGYQPISLVGWAQKPSYDAKEHELYWAKHLRFGNQETLNYAIRALGRTGVLQVNVVADMAQLEEINMKVPKLLTMVTFSEGHRYADFKEDSDPVAAYGLAVLVAGGVAAKAGLFKGLLAAAAAAWKLIAVAAVAVGAFIMRVVRGLFGRGGTPPTAT